VQLGLENKKKTMWAAVLGVVAVLAFSYSYKVVFPTLTSPSSPDPSAQAAAPAALPVTGRPARKLGKKPPAESLDPTLRLDLLAASEQTQYQGNGRNIFVSQAEVVIPPPRAPGHTDVQNSQAQVYRPPSQMPPPPIPLQFYGFANQAGEPKKIFLKKGEDVWVAEEGEIVDRRYKVIRISPASVEIQDVLYSGPAQTIPLTQG
jgi:hypothetical protein